MTTFSRTSQIAVSEQHVQYKYGQKADKCLPNAEITLSGKLC